MSVSFLIHTDGSVLVNPGGPGGWAYRIQCPSGDVVEASGHLPATTNNRAEARAVIEALNAPAIPNGWVVQVTSDSKYIVESYAKLEGWRARRRNGYCGATGVAYTS